MMKDSLSSRIRQKGCEAYSALCRPTVRHSLHCHCGIYRSPDEHTPLSAMRLDLKGACPLIRVLAILGIVALASVVVCRVCRAISCRCKHSGKITL